MQSPYIPNKYQAHLSIFVDSSKILSLMKTFKCKVGLVFVQGMLVLATTSPGKNALWAGDWILKVQDQEGRTTPCRVHLRGPDGQPVKPAGYPAWDDHFVIPGEVRIPLPEGTYTWEIEKGHEFKRQRGGFKIDSQQDAAQNRDLSRIVDLKKRGWRSGDLHIHRAPQAVPLLMEAEDLDVAPVITWWNQRRVWDETTRPKSRIESMNEGKWIDWMAGEDERQGGALLFFNLPEPLAIQDAKPEWPSPMVFLEQTRLYTKPHVDIEKPFWWDVPVWVASGLADTMGIANNHMYRRGVFENEAWGKARDSDRLPAPLGNGMWSQEIYYHVLNAGICLPPSAGSASGVLANPVGYNRVYVHTGEASSMEAWWEGLREGRSFVTNGPLLLTRVDDRLAGTVFKMEKDSDLEVALDIELYTQDPVHNVDLIFNGSVLKQLPLDPQGSPTEPIRVKTQLRVPGPGWLMIRAVTTVPFTYRFAASAPYYFKRGEGQPISADACRFFQDWVSERIRRLEDLEFEGQQSVLAYQEKALRFWQAREAMATMP